MGIYASVEDMYKMVSHAERSLGFFLNTYDGIFYSHVHIKALGMMVEYSVFITANVSVPNFIEFFL